MRVKVSLHGDVRKYLRGRPEPYEQELGPEATVDDLLRILAVDPAMPLTIGVNGELGRRDAALRDGDDVMILTPMEGG